jgi:hypothetical protein
MAIYPHDFINIQISYYLWLLRIIQNEKAWYATLPHCNTLKNKVLYHTVVQKSLYTVQHRISELVG